MIAYARVDFPEPLGPMSACVSPLATARSRPCRISLPSTATCRPRISSSAIASSGRSVVAGRGRGVLVLLGVDEDPAIVYTAGVDGDRVDRGQALGLARIEVEGAAVQVALDRVALYPALRQ